MASHPRLYACDRPCLPRCHNAAHNSHQQQEQSRYLKPCLLPERVEDSNHTIISTKEFSALCAVQTMGYQLSANASK